MEEAAEASALATELNERTPLLPKAANTSLMDNGPLLPYLETFLYSQPIELRIYLLRLLSPSDITATARASRTMRASITKPEVLTALRRLHVMKFWTTPDNQYRLRTGVSSEASFLGGAHSTRCGYGRHHTGDYGEKMPGDEQLTLEKTKIARRRSEILFQKNLLVSREILSPDILNAPDITKYFFLFKEYLWRLFSSRNMSIALLVTQKEILTEQEVRFLFPRLSTEELNLGLLIRLDHLEFLLNQFHQNKLHENIYQQTAREAVLLAYYRHPSLVDITTAIQQSPMAQIDHQGTQVLYGLNEPNHNFVTKHRNHGPHLLGRGIIFDTRTEGHGTAGCNAIGCLCGIFGCAFRQSCLYTGSISAGCYGLIIIHRFIIAGLADLRIHWQTRKLAGKMSHNFRHSEDCTAFFAPAGSLHRERPDIFENCLAPLDLEPEPLDPNQFNRNGGRSQTYILGLRPQ